MNIPQTNLERIVVIGAGFSGLQFVKKLDTKRYQVVLIDRNNYHTFQPLLYQVASSGLSADSIVYPVRKIFKHKKNFFFRKAEVHAIDSDNKQIQTDIGHLAYDKLIVATGGLSNYFGNANIEHYAMPMKSLLNALDLRSVIIQNFEEALNSSDLKERERLMNFVIVGAGPTGIELAGALAELRDHILPKDYPDLDIRRMQIHIIEANNRPLAAMSETASAKTKQYLEDMGVQLWLNTFVEDYDGEEVKTNQQVFYSKTLVWAAGIQGHAPQGLQVERARGNRLVVDTFHQLQGYEDIYILGDLAYMATKAFPQGHPMLASVAEQQGRHLAQNFNRVARGKELKEFRYNDKGSMATIGRNRAVVDLSFSSFGGFFGWLVWMFVHLMLLVDFRNRLIVFVDWMWSYINYDKGTRLIIREYKRKK